MAHEHRGEAAVLRDVHDLLLRHAADRAEPVHRRRKPHDGIERLVVTTAVREHGEEMHGQRAGRLHDPGVVWVVLLRERALEQPLPLRLRDGRAEMHACAAVRAIRLQHELLAVTPDELGQIGAAGRRLRRALGDEPRPEHVPAEQLPVGRVERVPRESIIGQDLETALVIEVARDRGHDPIAGEQRPDRLERLAELALEREQVADLVVAVRDVDDRVLVVDLAIDERELARIGVPHVDPALRAEIRDEMRLLVGPFRDVLRLDQANVRARPADRARVIEQHLEEQVALVARQLERQSRVVRLDRRHDVAHQQRLRERPHVDAADA